MHPYFTDAAQKDEHFQAACSGIVKRISGLISPFYTHFGQELPFERETGELVALAGDLACELGQLDSGLQILTMASQQNGVDFAEDETISNVRYYITTEAFEESPHSTKAKRVALVLRPGLLRTHGNNLEQHSLWNPALVDFVAYEELAVTDSDSINPSAHSTGDDWSVLAEYDSDEE
jgi:hypothetical protein